MRPLTVSLLILAAATASVGAGEPVTGLYMEDRTMRVYACPCEWSTDWAHRGREAILAWTIQSGEFGGVSLAGLNIIAVLVGDFSLTEASSHRRSVLYVDSSASKELFDAGVRWLRMHYRDLLGDVIAVHPEAIELRFDPDSVSLDVGSILRLRMQPTQLAKEAQSWAELIHEPFIKLASSNLATTSHVDYTGTELKIHWVREEDAITGYFGTFSAPSSTT